MDRLFSTCSTWRRRGREVSAEACSRPPAIVKVTPGLPQGVLPTALLCLCAFPQIDPPACTPLSRPPFASWKVVHEPVQLCGQCVIYPSSPPRACPAGFRHPASTSCCLGALCKAGWASVRARQARSARGISIPQEPPSANDSQGCSVNTPTSFPLRWDC